MNNISYEFLNKAANMLSSGQSRSIILTGNVHDLFCIPDDKGGRYAPLIEWMAEKWSMPEQNKFIGIVYELNSPIRFVKEPDRKKLKDAWLKDEIGLEDDEMAIRRVTESGKIDKQFAAEAKAFDSMMKEADSNSRVALELLRQFCRFSRTMIKGKPLLNETLIIILDGVDMMIPAGEISRLGEGDRYRVSTCQNWFSDPDFMNGRDSVIMLAESKSLVNRAVAGLPQILEVEIPSPDEQSRKHFISWFNEKQPAEKKIQFWAAEDELAKSTAALSIHALMQLLKGACFEGRKLEQKDVIAKVEDFIKSELGGEDIVEFKKPTHTLDNVVGYRARKKFYNEDLIPLFNKTGKGALSGIGVSGSIGCGKTYQFEAVASMLGRVVLVLKNFRSMWFGESDVRLERLRRILYALDKVLVFVDEADTAFGGVSKETHETERRLTGKIQAMMSDTALRGKVVWLLMTARIHLLSPDMRRPGRLDMILPILDPEGEDRIDFLKWILSSVLPGYKEEDVKALDEITKGYSAASFDVIRKRLIRKAEELEEKKHKLDIGQIKSIVNNYLQPEIAETRRYQEIQGLLNCTERSLLPNPDADINEEKKKWRAEIKLLEAMGITGD